MAERGLMLAVLLWALTCFGENGASPVVRTQAVVAASSSSVGLGALAVDKPAAGPAEDLNAILTLSLRTDKSACVALEPIRLLASVQNGSDHDFLIEHAPHAPAAKIDFQRLRDNGTFEAAGTATFSQFYENDVPGEPMPATIPWHIAPKSSANISLWIDEYVLQGFAAGKLRFRAVFKSMAGPSEGAAVISREIEITISQPSGPDLAAYQFLTLPLQQGVRGGLVANSGSHNSRDLHETILARINGSVYANYFRHTMLTYLDYHEQDRPEFEKRAWEILDTAPADFPWLADTYARLASYYKERKEMDKALAVFQKFTKAQLVIADPSDKARIEMVQAELDRWLHPPPPLPPGPIELTARARNLAGQHWLIKDLHQAYGEPQRSVEKPNYVEQYFSHPKSTKPVIARLFFTTNTEPAAILLQGPLEALRVGKLAGAVEDLEHRHNLEPEQAFEPVLSVVLEGDTGSGMLALPKQGPEFFRLHLPDKAVQILSTPQEWEPVSRRLADICNAATQGALPGSR